MMHYLRSKSCLQLSDPNKDFPPTWSHDLRMRLALPSITLILLSAIVGNGSVHFGCLRLNFNALGINSECYIMALFSVVQRDAYHDSVSSFKIILLCRPTSNIIAFYYFVLLWITKPKLLRQCKQEWSFCAMHRLLWNHRVWQRLCLLNALRAKLSETEMPRQDGVDFAEDSWSPFLRSQLAAPHLGLRMLCVRCQALGNDPA